MSQSKDGIKPITNKDGSKSYEVRYREGDRNRSRSFRRKRDAERFRDERRRRRALGELYDDGRGDTTLADFVVGRWLEDHAVHHLRPKTLMGYVDVLDRHALPHIGSVTMRGATPGTFDSLGSTLLKAGVGRPTVRRVLYILQGIFRQAEIWEYCRGNPVRAVRKPRQKRVSQITVHPPARVEAVRAHLSAGRLADAVLVCVIAYAGLRPGEALALRWRNVRVNTLHIEASASLGADEDTKTFLARDPDLLPSLAEDLAELRIAAGDPPGDALVFPGRDGEIWTDSAYRNWRTRIFRPAALAAGISRPRPYDLRHSFVTLLIYAGTVLPEVARQAGHGPEVCAATYVHVLAEFDPRVPVDPEEAIRDAREAHKPSPDS